MDICFANLYFKKFYEEELFEQLLRSIVCPDSVDSIVFDFETLTFWVTSEESLRCMVIPGGFHKYKKFFIKISINFMSGRMSYTSIDNHTFSKLIFI